MQMNATPFTLLLVPYSRLFWLVGVSLILSWMVKWIMIELEASLNGLLVEILRQTDVSNACCIIAEQSYVRIDHRVVDWFVIQDWCKKLFKAISKEILKVLTIVEVEFVERHSDHNVTQRLGLNCRHVVGTNPRIALIVSSIYDIDNVKGEPNDFLLCHWKFR